MANGTHMRHAGRIRRLRHIAGLAFAMLLAILLSASPIATSLPRAIADEPASGGQQSQAQLTALELQQQVESTQQAYSEALDEADRASEEVEAQQKRIDEISENDIPAQQRRSAQATRELYKIQQQSVGIIDMLLSSGSLADFIEQLEYVNRVNSAHTAEIERLYELKDELEAARDDLKEKQSQANARVEDARAAMEVALEVQAENQRRLEEEARQAAEAAANAAKLAEQPRDNEEGMDASAVAPPADGGGSLSGPSAVASSPDEASFLAEWGPRINAYLAGSPLAGQGYTFAKAAYTYGVDPRWSPAISFTESSKGACCFRPHNAWGWGSSSWGSWEEAIDAHVRGLSRGYGYTISPEAAKKYCPPNWQFWYNKTSAQMDLI